jgi:K+-sensing histidine kinase KdpD
MPTPERLLVCLGPNPSSADVIRATKRMATSLNAEWVAVYVKTPRMVQLPEVEQNRAVQNLQLAENLGAQTFTLFSRSMAEMQKHKNRLLHEVFHGGRSTIPPHHFFYPDHNTI